MGTLRAPITRSSKVDRHPVCSLFAIDSCLILGAILFIRSIKILFLLFAGPLTVQPITTGRETPRHVCVHANWNGRQRFEVTWFFNRQLAFPFFAIGLYLIDFS